MKTVFKTLVAAAALAIPSALSAQVQIIGTATGCFFQGPIGNQCATGSSSTSLANLQYIGGSFDVTVGPDGEVQFKGNASNNLGRFLMSDPNLNFTAAPGASYGFRLFISIVAPSTSPDGVKLIATLDGDLNVSGPGDEIVFNFPDAFTTFTYDGGSFGFRAIDEDIRKGEMEYLGFRIDCGVASNGTCGIPVPPQVAPALAQVSEPASLALVAGGLIGLVGAARRRRSA